VKKLLVFFTSLFLATEVLASEVKSIPFYQDLNSGDAMVLVVNAQGFEAKNSIIAYNLKDGIFIPIVSFANIIEFPTKISLDGLSASGWFMDEKNSFYIDLNKKIISSKKAKFTLNSGNVKKFDGDIFVKLEVLEKIFNLKLSISSYEQALMVNSDAYVLPLVQKIEREKKWGDFWLDKKRSLSDKSQKTLEVKAPYRLMSPPVIDFRLDRQYVKPKNNNGGLGPDMTRIGILANADILSLNTKVALNTFNGQVTNTFVSAGRTSQDADLLGFMKATEFSFGDVYSQRTPLVSVGRSGAGATVSNYPTQYVSGDVDSIPLRGVIQSGWDVEVYRNNYLIDVQKTAADGVYEFPSIPLISGTNKIRIVFYGPNGQKKEENRTYVINSEVLQSGKLYYRFTTNKNNQNLIDTSQNRIALASTDKSQGMNRYFGEVAYGLARNLSIAANYNELPIGINGEVKKFLGSGIRTSIKDLYLRLDNVKDLDLGVNASQLSAQTNLGSYNLLAKLDKYDEKFISEERQGTFNPNQRSTFKVSGPVPLPFLNKISQISLGRIEETFENSKKRFLDDADLSINIFSRLNISQNLRNTRDERFNNPAFRAISTGQTILNYRVTNNISLRSNLGYNIKPIKELTFYNADLNYYISKTLNLSLNTAHQFASSSSVSGEFTNYGIAIAKSIKSFTTSLATKKDNRGGYMINFSFAMSVGYDPSSNSIKTSSSPMSSIGAVVIRAFLDENSNGIYEDSEQLLSGVEFEGGGSGNKNITGNDGRVFITNIPTDGGATIAVKEESLKNFYWSSANKLIKIKTHAGALTNIDFPIIIAGEIEGNVKSLDKKFSQIAGITLELLNDKDEIVATVDTGYDGLFYFDKIPLGKYKIVVQKKFSQDVGYGNGAFLEVNLSKDNKNLTGIEFKINKNKAVKSVVKKDEGKVGKIQKKEVKKKGGKVIKKKKKK
jgi:hypothetical protein